MYQWKSFTPKGPATLFTRMTFKFPRPRFAIRQRSQHAAIEFGGELLTNREVPEDQPRHLCPFRHPATFLTAGASHRLGSQESPVRCELLSQRLLWPRC